MEEVCELENCKQALQRVKANKGVGGRRMTVTTPEYLKQHAGNRGAATNGTYQPQPVRRVEIPKPDGAGVGKLGIPVCWIALSSRRVAGLQKRGTRILRTQPGSDGAQCEASGARGAAVIAEGYRWVWTSTGEIFDRVNPTVCRAWPSAADNECSS